MKPTDIKPPFDEEKAKLKVKAAENAWNTCNPELVAQAYTEDSRWRNRTEFFTGRKDIVEFLRRKWAKELNYKLMKELGVIQEIVFPFVLNMNGEMLTIQINGCVPMVMSIGNSMRTV